jgi:hypothetical protein
MFFMIIHSYSRKPDQVMHENLSIHMKIQALKQIKFKPYIFTLSMTVRVLAIVVFLHKWAKQYWISIMTTKRHNDQFII